MLIKKIVPNTNHIIIISIQILLDTSNISIFNFNLNIITYN